MRLLAAQLNSGVDSFEAIEQWLHDETRSGRLGNLAQLHDDDSYDFILDSSDQTIFIQIKRSGTEVSSKPKSKQVARPLAANVANVECTLCHYEESEILELVEIPVQGIEPKRYRYTMHCLNPSCGAKFFYTSGSA